MDNYFRLRIANISTSEEDLLTSLCFENGAAGISENLPFAQPREDFEPMILATERHDLDVFFEKLPAKDFLETVRLRFPNCKLEMFSELNKDWLEEWKKGFEPFELVRQIWIVPSWRDVPKSALRSIHIDPGMAFGTGTHDTTALASQLLFELAGSLNLRPLRLLDVGTGTGILAILASILDVGQVEATEIDPVGREVARENFQRNKVIALVHDVQVDALDGHYDVVVANIIDGVLIKIQKDLKRLVKPKGHLLMTGVLLERQDNFESEFSTENFKLVNKKERGEWLGYHLVKS